MRTLLPLLLTTAACTVGTGTPLPSEHEAIDRIVLEIDLVGDIDTEISTLGWAAFDASLDALFEGSGIEVVVPPMGELEGYIAYNWTLPELRAISWRNLDTEREEGMSLVHVMVMGGYMPQELWDTEHPGSAWIPHLGVIGVWPLDLVGGYGANDDTFDDEALVALVHGIGHAVGLVDAEIPAQTDHAVGGLGHCSGRFCVMRRHAVDGWGHSAAKANRNLLERSEGRSLFGEDCLADARARWAALATP